MSLFGNIARGLARSLGQLVQDSVKRVQEGGTRLLKQGMFDRAAIVVALVSFWADKKASPGEIATGIRGIQALVGQDTFNGGELRDKVNANVAELVAGGDIAYADLRRKLGGVADKDDARFLVDLAIVVGKADGEVGEDPFSEAEKNVVRDICQTLGLPPSDFGL